MGVFDEGTVFERRMWRMNDGVPLASLEILEVLSCPSNSRVWWALEAEISPIRVLLEDCSLTVVCSTVRRLSNIRIVVSRP
jgi:hypothetical protein